MAKVLTEHSPQNKVQMDNSINDDASVVRDMAWRQIDTHDNGYIYAHDFDLLIDAIDSILNRSLLSEHGRAIIKDFTKTDAHTKIIRSDFKPLFETLTGISFKKALDVIDFDKKVVELERKNMKAKMTKRENGRFFNDSDSEYGRGDALRKIPVLTSTPLSNIINDSNLRQNDSISTSQLIDPPNFKKQFSKYKILNDNKNDEIKYRDQVIERLETDKPNLRKIEMKVTDLERRNDSLEEEVLYRDRIILQKDQELSERLDNIKRLDNEILQLKNELYIYKSENKKNIKELQDKNKDFYNKELLKRIKTQQVAIDNLKSALSKNIELVKTTPIIFQQSSSNQDQSGPSKTTKSYPRLNFTFNKAVVILTIIFTSLILLYSLSSATHSTREQLDPWYTGTFLEPFLYSLLEDRDVDYDHYNLGDISVDSLKGL